MPMYEYRCTHCGHIVEVLVSKESGIFLVPTCSKCQHLMERKLSIFNNHFTPTKTKEKE